MVGVDGYSLLSWAGLIYPTARGAVQAIATMTALVCV